MKREIATLLGHLAHASSPSGARDGAAMAAAALARVARASSTRASRSACASASSRCATACARLGHPERAFDARPRRGHQRQGQRRARWSSRSRAPRACGRGSTRRRTSAASPSASGSTASRSTTPRSRTSLDRALDAGAGALVLRGGDARGVPRVPRGEGRPRRRRGGPRRAARRDQRARRGRAPRRSRASRSTTPTASGRRSSTSRARRPGIAKPGLDIVLGPMAPEVRAAIDEVARARGATTTPRGDDAPLRRRAIGLAGRAPEATTRAIAASLGARIGASPDAPSQRGLARVALAGPARAHRRAEGPYLLDAAHNPDGAEALARAPARRSAIAPAETRRSSSAPWPTRTGAAMLDALAPLAGARVYVAPQGGARAPRRPRGARRAPRRDCGRPASTRGASERARRRGRPAPSSWSRARSSSSARPARVCSACRAIRPSRFEAGAAAASIARAGSPMPSFDIVSKVQRNEVDNAFNQAQKGDRAALRLQRHRAPSSRRAHEAITIRSGSEDRAQGGARRARRTSSSSARSRSRFIDPGKPEKTGKGGARIVVKIKEGIEAEKARAIVQAIKDAKLKVQASIQEARCA